MATLTAVILRGEGHPYHGGLLYDEMSPSALWLSENSLPAWIRYPDNVVWIPREPGRILEDGLAMLVALSDAHVLEIVGASAARRLELEELQPDKYEALHSAVRDSYRRSSGKVIMARFVGSSLPDDVRQIASDYHIEVEVLSPIYARLMQFSGEIREFGRDELR